MKRTHLIFIRKHWVTTPIFYYLDADKYHVVGDLQPDSYAKALQDDPDARVWVLSFPYTKAGTGLEQALSGYRITQTIQALNIQADLYEKQLLESP